MKPQPRDCEVIRLGPDRGAFCHAPGHQKAEQYGSGWVSVRIQTHFGMRVIIPMRLKRI